MLASIEPQSRIQPLQELWRKITDYNISARPQDPLGTLKRHRLQVEYTRFSPGMDHRKLSRHLIRRHRQILPNLLRITNDIEIAAGGLDHDDVGALGNIAANRPASKPAAAGGKLVAFAVAEGGAGACSVAEGAVEAAAKFGRVGHQDDAVGDAGLDQLELDGADTAVVHVRRSNTVGARFGVGDSDIRDAVDAQGVIQSAVVAQDAAMAVGGVFAKADVSYDKEVGEALAEEANGGDDGASGVICSGAEGIFGTGGDRDAEEDNGAETSADEGFEVWDEFVDAAAGLVGERGDEGFFVVLVRDEERIYEHGLMERSAMGEELWRAVEVPLLVVSRPATIGQEDGCSRHVIDLICLLICSHSLQLCWRMI